MSSFSLPSLRRSRIFILYTLASLALIFILIKTSYPDLFAPLHSKWPHSVSFTDAILKSSIPLGPIKPYLVRKPKQNVNVTAKSIQSLANRIEPYLVAWMERPVRSYEEALISNEVACGKDREEQSNPDQLNNAAKLWSAITSQAVLRIRAEVISGIHQFFHESLSQVVNGTQSSHLTLEGVLGRPLMGEDTQGIVITGGNSDTMRRLMVTIRILRKKHECHLPIEIFMFPEELEQVTDYRTEILALGGIEIKPLPYPKDQKAWKNFQIKGASIIHSSFTRVLYLDSDNIPLVDPTFLFESPVFKQWGIVLWPDITKDGARNPIWRLASQTCIPQDWQIDSGQILVDKSAQRGLVFGALLVAAQMQLHHQFWFRISEGDKDTFRYALYSLQLPWNRAPHWLSSGGGFRSGNEYCGHTMFQYSLSSEDWRFYPSFSKIKLSETQREHAPPLFAHVNLLKHTGGFNRGETFKVLHSLGPSDLVTRQNLNISDMVRAKVKSEKGLCVYYTILNQSPSQSVVSVKPNEDGPKVWILEESWKEAWGGLLKDFESMYWENGGL